MLLPFILFWVFFIGLFFLLCFLSREVPLAFVVRLDCWCWILLTFTYLLKIDFFIKCEWSNLGVFFSFYLIILSISCHSLLAYRISVERPAVSLMGIPFYVICWFSLAAFNICSLYLIFVSLINMHLGVFLFVFILCGSLLPLNIFKKVSLWNYKKEFYF